MLALQVIALVLMSLGGFIAVANWLSIYLSWYTGRFHSPIPVIGGLFLFVGMFLLPAMRLWSWTAVLLDYGTMGLLIASPYIIADLWSTSRFNLLEEYIGRNGNKTVHLRLFRKGIFALEVSIQLDRNEVGVTGAGTTGTWKRESGRLLLQRDGESAVLERSPGIASESLEQVIGFPAHKGTELSLAGAQLHLKFRRSD